MGDFNGWKKTAHPLQLRGGSGIWEGFIRGVKKGARYKYYIVSQYNCYRVDKIDPFSFYYDVSPKTASIVWDLEYAWDDGDWMTNQYGGRENLEAIAFLRRFNEKVYENHPDVHTIAEESTAWPMVSRSTSVGGLGFGMKWISIPRDSSGSIATTLNRASSA